MEDICSHPPRAHPLNAGPPPLLIGWLWPWVEIPPKGSNVCTCFLAGLTLATATFRSHRLPVTNYTAHGIRGTSCVKDLPGLAAPKCESNLQPVDCKSSALNILHYTATLEDKICQAVREDATTCPRSGLQWNRAAAALSQAGRARPVMLEVWTYSKVPALMGNYGTDPGILWGVRQDMYFQYYNFNSTELTDIPIQPTAPPQTLQAPSANTRHPAGRPHTPPADLTCATDVRQTSDSVIA